LEPTGSWRTVPFWSVTGWGGAFALGEIEVSEI